MKKLFLMAAVAVTTAMTATGASAQETNTGRSVGKATVASAPVGGGAMSVSQKGFFMGGNRISVGEAKDLSRPFPEAMRHIRTGQFVYGASIVAAAGGGYMIGWQIGNAINGKGVNAGALAAGVAIVGGAIGLTYITVGQYRKAAAAYNSATGLAELPRHDITLALSPTRGGLGLQLTF